MPQGPVPFVMQRVSSPWPLALGSHHPELNLLLPLYLHTELSGANVFLNNLQIFWKEKSFKSPKNLSLFPSFKWLDLQEDLATKLAFTICKGGIERYAKEDKAALPKFELASGCTCPVAETVEGF